MIKKVTIDGLAIMVSKGFAETKFDVNSLRSDMNKRFDAVDKRFDRMENLILADHKRRIEKLELDMKELKNALAM
ncbi:MAG: hypothetical protein HY454_03690 [Parcubacteria group bacterium]|nr:hypothetical protein [Parcubacteria group bacterium]